MRTYERETRVAAPLDDVWAFHATLDGLRTLTPDWLHLRVDSVRRGDGTPVREQDPDLGPGTRMALSVQPFGVGPRQRWVAEILDRERDEGRARFRDAMRRGPVREWVHTHEFVADGDGTLLRDRVRYTTGAGTVGDALATPGLDVFFRYRHRRTRDVLEG